MADGATDMGGMRRVGPQPVILPDVTRLAVHSETANMLESRGIVSSRNNHASRAINLLRAQLLRRASKQDINLIGVTSAAPDAGKSFVTANLAIALARIQDQAVVLLDLDLRRPTIADRLGLEIDSGLEAWLSGTTDDLVRIGRRFGDTALSIYATQGWSDGSGDLLANARFDSLIAALRALPKSTIVLCDLPPAFVSDDAVNVVTKLDAYIHVIDEGVTPRRQAEELRAMMEPAKCLGAVLNRYAGRWNDSYGYAASRKYARYYDPAA
jgi:protein-tyrosine kinase